MWEESWSAGEAEVTDLLEGCSMPRCTSPVSWDSMVAAADCLPGSEQCVAFPTEQTA